MTTSKRDRNAAEPRGVSRRAALLALGLSAAAGVVTTGERPASARERIAKSDDRLEPGYRETDHIRRFYDCARF